MEDLSSLWSIVDSITSSDYTPCVLVLGSLECQNYISDCMNVDACTCEDPRGNIVFNLHSLDSPSSPMQNQISSSTIFYYNPCSPISTPDCSDQSVCLTAGNHILEFGSAETGTFVADGGQVTLLLVVL